MKVRKEIFVIKYIGLITMLIDHIGIVLYPNNLLLRIIGRTSFPIFCYTTAQGTLQTHNINKYLIRLLIFSLVSQFPYYLSINQSNLNIGFTLFFSVLLLKLYNNNKLRYKILCVGLLIALGWLPLDYGLPGPILIFAYYISSKKKIKIIVPIAYVCILYYTYMHFGICTAILQSACLIDIFLISLDFQICIPQYLYNILKKSNYIFYPLHLLILYLLSI